MIENLHSNTKTASAIAFNGKERYFAADAISKYSKHPEWVFIKLNQFLGFNISKFNFSFEREKQKEETNLNKEIEDSIKLSYLYNNNILYNIKTDTKRNSIYFSLNSEKLIEEKNDIFSIEEIYAMIFRYIQSFSSKYLGKEIKEFIIAIPSFFGYKQRNSLIQSLTIANIKIKNLITTGLSAGFYYALENSFINNNKNFISYNLIYDMGSSYTQVSLFSYNTYLKNQNKKNLEIINMKKIYETYDNTLGGKYFDLKIAEILSKKYKNYFNDKQINELLNNDFKRNLKKNKTANEEIFYKDFLNHKKKFEDLKNIYLISKFLHPANRIKEILSANKEYRFNLIVENESFVGNITRREFEEYSSDLFERIATPIDRILDITNKHINEIDSIQIIGGGTRIPKIREILNSKYGSKKILFNLNSDNSISMGAAYFNANKTLENFSYKNKMIISNNYYPFNGDIKIRIRNLEYNEDSLGKKSSEEKFCLEKNSNIQIEEENQENQENNYECLEKVDEERTIFSKDLNREKIKILKFQNKINSNLIIEMFESFKENKHQFFDSYLSKNKTLIKEIADRKILENQNKNNLDLIGTYKINNIENYLNSIRNEIDQNLGTSNSIKNHLEIPITLNIILSVDGLGLINIKAELLYEIKFHLNFEKTKNGEYKFFYSSKYIEKLNNKTLTEEFNYINTSGKFKNYSKNDKNNLKKKLQYEIGSTYKSEFKRREILLEFFPSNFPLPLTKKQLLKSKIMLNSLDTQDENKRKIGEKLNNLENLIYTRFEQLKDDEYQKFISSEESHRINFILNQIKEDMYENNNAINPFYNMINKKNNFNKIYMFNNKLNKISDDLTDFDIIEEKVKLINNLFENIDKSYDIYKKRNLAIREFQSLFDTINKENENIKLMFNQTENRNSEHVDLNSNKYQKDINKLIISFEKNVLKKLKDFELILSKNIEKQTRLSLRDVMIMNF